MKKILIVIFITLLIVELAYTLEISSTNFIVDLPTFLNGGGLANSSNYNTNINVIGGLFAYLQWLSSYNFIFLPGQPHLITVVMPSPPQQPVKVLSDLMATTEVFGQVIPEKTWQRDNDPYFYWQTRIEIPDFLIGCSVSLDNLPDETVDTTFSYYQILEDSIPSGKHIFYVLPSTTLKGWDWFSLLQFEIWVDTDMPQVNQLKPSPGEFTSNNLIPVSCFVYDKDSGLDIASTALSIDGRTVFYNYNSATHTLSYTPEAPFRDGKNTILLKVYDMVGNYVVKGWDFIVDTQPPSGSVLINAGDDLTHSAYVNLHIQAEDAVSGVKSIFISNDGIFDTELANPYSFAPVIYHWLVSSPNTDGLKTVYIKFQDAAGNISATFSDQINLKLLTPDTYIIWGPSGITEKTEAEFRYEASKPGCSFSYKLHNLG
ncbi:MAG: hypothetical protein NC908_02590, partial [Candidatus Omnitrophica bacterium]|nr:hypothetical protein [Candidatus Omnitrophota bacterium]